LEVTSQKDIQAAVEAVAQTTGSLDLLVNNAGVSKPGNFGSLTEKAMQETFAVNTFAPVLITQAFVPLLLNGQTPKVVSISSGLGSIEEAQGSHHIYSASKAALNMFAKSLSYSLRQQGIIHIAIDPGWVQTDMGGLQAPLEPEVSISGMLDIIDKLTLSDTGRFLRYDGAELPW
jgi:NAD(P)-dependent dehydrogenase (short-subunit alcohol dehydrogenase family)